MASPARTWPGFEPIQRVLLEGKVALKVIQHCRQNTPSTVFGQLLGLAVDGALEITDSFALPLRGEDEGDGTDYSYEMMRCLREVNVDNNTVGWYQSSFLGLHLNQFLVDTQFQYQSDITESVVLIYDPLETSHGVLSLKAYRLSDAFLKLRKENNFTKESLIAQNFSFKQMFEEIPVQLTTSDLQRSLLYYFDLDEQLFDQFESLDLASDDYMEKNIDGLLSCVYDMQKEQNIHAQWQRNISALEKKQREFLTKRKADNQTRKEKGFDPLPETQKELEIEAPTVFKKPPEPSRLESLLIAQRIDSHCDQVMNHAAQSLTKQFFLKSLND